MGRQLLTPDGKPLIRGPAAGTRGQRAIPPPVVLPPLIPRNKGGRPRDPNSQRAHAEARREQRLNAKTILPVKGPRLRANGELTTRLVCAPGMQAANLQKYGFEDPLAQYKYGTETVSAIAAAWGIKLPQLWNEIQNTGLKAIREARRACTDAPKIFTPAEIEEQAELARAKHIQVHNRVLDLAVERLEEGTEDVFPGGREKRTKRLSGSSFRAIVDGARIAADIGRPALGLPNKITRQSSTSDRTTTQVVRIVRNRPDGAYQPPALPEPDDDILDAEVSD